MSKHPQGTGNISQLHRMRSRKRGLAHRQHQNSNQSESQARCLSQVCLRRLGTEQVLKQVFLDLTTKLGREGVLQS